MAVDLVARAQGELVVVVGAAEVGAAEAVIAAVAATETAAAMAVAAWAGYFV